METISADVEEVSRVVVDAAFKVHKALGPGLLKSVERLQPVFLAQLLTYLKLTGLRLGLLINFNVPVIRDGIRKIVL